MAQVKRKPVEDVPTEYESDFYLWCFVQAEHLRQRRFGQLDLPNLIEELESMGRSDRRALKSSYRLLLHHLLKWQFQPDMRSPSWEITIERERDVINETETESPTLAGQARTLIDEMYPKARRDAARETGLDRAIFPADCPYTLDQLHDSDWLPEPASKGKRRPRLAKPKR